MSQTEKTFHITESQLQSQKSSITFLKDSSLLSVGSAVEVVQHAENTYKKRITSMNTIDNIIEDVKRCPVK